MHMQCDREHTTPDRYLDPDPQNERHSATVIINALCLACLHLLFCNNWNSIYIYTYSDIAIERAQILNLPILEFPRPKPHEFQLYTNPWNFMGKTTTEIFIKTTAENGHLSVENQWPFRKYGH